MCTPGNAKGADPLGPKGRNRFSPEFWNPPSPNLMLPQASITALVRIPAEPRIGYPEHPTFGSGPALRSGGRGSVPSSACPENGFVFAFFTFPPAERILLEIIAADDRSAALIAALAGPPPPRVGSPGERAPGRRAAASEGRAKQDMAEGFWIGEDTPRPVQVESMLEMGVEARRACAGRGYSFSPGPA
jgi:hypothetical protein